MPSGLEEVPAVRNHSMKTWAIWFGCTFSVWMFMALMTRIEYGEGLNPEDIAGGFIFSIIIGTVCWSFFGSIHR